MKVNEMLSNAEAVVAKTEAAAAGTDEAAKKSAAKEVKKTTRRTAVKEQKEEAAAPKADAAEKKEAEMPKKAAVKKTTKAAAGKAKTSARKPAASKAVKQSEIKREVYVQFNGEQIDEETLLERVKEDCESQNITVNELKMYLKPEDNACYYVANGNIAGRVDLY